MNPDETDQDQSGIKGIVMNPGLDQNLSEIGIEVTDPGLNQDQSGISTRAKHPGSDQDQSGIRAEATSPASDPDASGIALGATAPGLNLDQSEVGRESDNRWSGIRAGQGESRAAAAAAAAVQSSTGSGRKGPRHVHEKRKGGAQAGCCRGESNWTTMSNGRGVVVEVREKRGVLRSVIPTMPFPLAVFCLVLNTFLPGMGTFVSAFAALCGAPTDQQQRHVCVAFLLNVAAALIQFLTAVVIVGWIMSIFWGMDMVILATYSTQDKKDRSTHLTMRESL